MADTPYAHLHVHTEYSMLDGAARLKELFKEVARHQMTHVAMTDHGNMYGAAEFHRQAKDAGITPVIGIEAYVAPESRRNTSRILWGQPHQKRDDVSASGSYLHKTIWARNNEGLHNLFKLTSRSYAEGWLTKYARMDKEILAEHAAGLMASTGCPSGELQTRLRLGQPQEALKSAAEYQDIFGKENYFLELMDHGLDIETRVREGLIEIGRKLNIPPVVTNDSHYSKETDAQAQELLLCIQTGKTLADEDRFKFDGTGYYIKSPAEMYAVNNSDIWQEGCRNSQLLIADRVDTRSRRSSSPRTRYSRPRSGRAWTAATRTATTRRARSRRPTSSPSSSRWGSPPTSSSSPTSSTGRRTTASRSARAGAARPGRSSPTRWASPTSTRSTTA
jgi:DNA polymerase-3 subunit alpha